MAGGYDIHFSGDAQAARDLVTRVFTEHGFAAEPNPSGGLTATRGKAGVTLLLGALAGKNLQMTFYVEFSTADDATFIARISRNTAAAALKGGAIGASRTNTEFADIVNGVAAAAHAAGTFVSAVAG